LEVVKGGQTVSATRFAALTGVSRERLRTWERRYGFPRPHRVGHGPRRYEIADAGAVVAVRRAAEQGVPLPRAIDAASSGERASALSGASLGAVAEHLPAPLVILSGPSPMRIEYVNPALAALPGAEALEPGSEVSVVAPWYADSLLHRAVSTLLSTDERSRQCAHPPWTDPEGAPVRSLLYRLPVEPRGLPLVAVVQLEPPAEREAGRALAALREERRQIEAQLDRHERWLQAIAELAELFQHEAGTRVMQATADTLVRLLHAIDAGIAVYMGGELALGSTSRGLLGPRMVTVTTHAELAAVLRERAPAWLAPSTAAAFGAGADVHVLAVPVAVVGETLGALLLVMEDRSAIDDDIRQLVSVLTAAVGFILLRDRLVEGARAPRPASRV
jgi:DNA-binding transcriptional MerR regulator